MMDWALAVEWVPTLAVAAMSLVACAGAVLLPERPARRRLALLAAVLCGGVAVAAAAWQQHRQQQLQAAAFDDQRSEYAGAAAEVAAGVAERLRVAWDRFNTIDRALPAAPGPVPGVSFDTVGGGFAALAAKADDLEKRVKAFREAAHGRSIDEATAAAMIEYLRTRGGHRVVVSCVPDDAEAYRYGNRIATILRRAGWDAVGPEPTAIFGDEPAMGISLYVRPGQPADAAHPLVEALTRFSIPYQSRIFANEAIPDDETIELFVGKKP